jgi:hypothetical protein
MKFEGKPKKKLGNQFFFKKKKYEIKKKIILKNS